MASAPITINADEVNCLIYAYLRDSGFTHSAFNLRNEGRLDLSSNFPKHIPRGELVELLIKALLYMEVEAHWRGNDLTANCTTGFSLLESHVCSLNPAAVKPTANLPPVPVLDPKPHPLPAIERIDSAQKRKASTPITEDARSEKRLKSDTEGGDSAIETVQTPDPSMKSKKDESKVSQNDPPNDNMLYDPTSKKLKRPKSPGPDDDETDPDAVRLLSAHKAQVFVCAWNPVKHGLLASGSKDAIVHLWNLPGPPKDGLGHAPPHFEPPRTLKYAPREDGDLTSLDWNHDGTLLAIGSYDAVLRVCDASGEMYFSDSTHTAPIFTTRFSKSGQWLLTASLDYSTCLWDIRTKTLHMHIRGQDSVLDVDWLNDDTYVSCGSDRYIHAFNVNRDSPTTSFSGHEQEINQVKANPTGTRIASCSDDRTARIWSTSSIQRGSTLCEESIVLRGHSEAVNGVSWCSKPSAEGHELLATSSFDHTARLWDAETGECLKVFANHKRPIYTIQFSPNGMWLATGSGDGMLHIYDVEAREKIWTWHSEGQKRSVFEIDWQQTGDIDRIAMGLESRKVGVIDVTRLPALQRRLR
ncbi:WD40 repeat-like protein [Artomyces pyxidatus]|uniref:WD40 repeat-like protein n=1 Tax=Artomyces pyxidatus TaxID=48021 RepID=A0ACB8TD91_9AGAM|nr:WD40 repeat-like protein [Artomyces pyxidatus]